MSDWSFENLESLIEDRGENVILETGISCPTCRAEDIYGSTILRDGVPATAQNGRIGCPVCYGLGWIYRNAREVRGLITSVQAGANKNLLEGGWAVPGDSVFSPSLGTCALSDFDRITICYPVSVGSGQTIVRNAANMEDNAALSSGLTPQEDRLWYRPSYAVWCEDMDGNVYTQGVDYEFDGKIIRWGATKPADGKVYALKYFAYLEWIIFATPMARFDNGRSLGQKVLLRKAHTAFINAHPVDTVPKRVEQEASFTTKITL